MTYYETQQQNPMHNSQFNPQQWAAFNSQAGQPYAAWPSAPLMQAIGGYGLGGYRFGQAASGQQYREYGGHALSRPLGQTAGGGAPPYRWGQSPASRVGSLPPWPP